MSRISLCLLILLAVAPMARAADDAREPYPLDAVPREVPPETRRIRCDRAPLVRYRGTAIRYRSHVEIHRDFVPYVARFERIAREVAMEHFGRAPLALAHHGSFNCRTIRSSRDVLSEHAFGNALDVRGFDFARARSRDALPEGAPAAYARSFQIRVERDWDAPPESRDAAKAAFLRALCERIVREPDLFRVILGPSFPGHKNHLHFDRAPFRYVQL